MSRTYSLALCCLLLWTPNALAHSPIKELNSFLNGLLHPLLVPSHVLLWLALGLLIGRHNPTRHLWAVRGFLLATATGLALSQAELGLIHPSLILGLTVLLGLLILSEAGDQPILLTGLAVLSGLLLGLDSDPEVYTVKALSGALFGSGASLYLLMLYAMALADRLRHKHWQQIGIRVIGSWITASAVLVLALQLAPLR